jgi:hypothetical protein
MVSMLCIPSNASIPLFPREIVGSIALKELETNPLGLFAVALRELLDKQLKNPSERSQFALPGVDASGGGDSAGHG